MMSLSTIAVRLALPALLLAVTQNASVGTSRAEAARLNNVGTALMNQQLLDKAEQKFVEAYAADHSLAVARLNEGIAALYLQQIPAAEAALTQASAQAPGDPRAWYALGLLYRSESKPQQALDAFARVLKLDPQSADSQYFIASIELELSQLPEAVKSYQAALSLSPLHASAEFGLARTLQRLGRTDEARAAFERFQHLTHERLGAPISHNYGEEGAYGRVEDAADATPRVGALIPIHFSKGWQSRTQAGAATGDLSRPVGAACLIELDGTARPGGFALIVMGSGEDALRLYRNTSQSGKPGFEEIPAASSGLHLAGQGRACAVGDYDNDGLPDIAVALGDRVVLFRNNGGDKFEDVTTAAGLTAANRPAGLTFVDYDHDGDLDLLVTGAALTGASANVLYRNNGNRTFTNWTKETGLGGSGTTSMAVPSDLNNDRAIDLVVAGQSGSPVIYTNPREGTFGAAQLSTAISAPSNAVAILDFDKDGRMDIAVAQRGHPGISLWRNVDGRRFDPVPLPADPGDPSGITTSVVAIDIDNDGWLDLVSVQTSSQGTRLRALRNLGPAGFKDETAALGLDKLSFQAGQSLLAADVDGDGDTDLVLAGEDGAVSVLSNDGGNQNHALRIVLKGVADNRSAIGTKVEVFANGLWQKWEATGQPEILAGLGQADAADLVRLLWPTGVPQDELDVNVNVASAGAAGKPLLLTETDRRGSSCPTLFAWNGAKYSFITDVIGAGVVGHWVSPTARNTPDPDEWVKVPGTRLVPRDGMLSLRFGEPMEEVNFVDQVRLLAVDHPAGTDAEPNEGFLSEPPFAQARRQSIVLARNAHLPAAAWDDHGRDVLAELRDEDHTYVRDFVNLPYAGFANMHTLTLDLGAGATAGRPLRLLLHGFVEYFSASSMFAAWQSGIAPVPPRVEAQLADGSWQVIVEDMGFPAGLPRTIVVDLSGKLPAGARRLRIVTNLQIYWDQILVDEADLPAEERAGSVGSELHVTELPLASGRLAFRGYPRQVDGRTPGDLDYDYTRISKSGPFVPQRGTYTRYGDVTPLLSSVDDEFVIFGTGEDMDLEFAASALPGLPHGWTRDYFFYANGYVKDMDFYEASPFTVDMLPFHAMTGYPYPDQVEHYPNNAAHLAYQLEWNTRFESGVTARSYQFHYQPRDMQPDTLPSATVREAARGSEGSSPGTVQGSLLR